ncbi:MAG: ABC transporter permease [Actinobacteria bacterium]|jgi:ABC-type polysaccharide/polyol phosphate export permease|nr:MAG: ABC transporter permease [Actinomycetota bacterium]
MKENLKRLFEYRELLFNLTRKEVKVKYKNSFLGFIWSLVTPLMMLVVFYVAFGVIFKLRAMDMKYYAFYLMAGILPWNFLSQTLTQGVASVVMNSDLVKKVYFPREVLPLSYLGSASFHFLLQEAMLIVFLLAFRVPLTPWIFMLPVLMLLEAVFIAGLTLLLSTLNVFFRDVQHFTEILLMAWFWMTPIVYPISQIRDNLPAWAAKLYMLNPMTHIVLMWQRITYNSPVNGPASYSMSPAGVIGTVACSLGLLIVGYVTFTRLEGRFAEFI